MNINNSTTYYTNNYFINNNYHVEDSEQNGMEEIMNYCHANYRNILPNKPQSNFCDKNSVFSLKKPQIVEILKQFDLLVQLLTQVLKKIQFLVKNINCILN